MFIICLSLWCTKYSTTAFSSALYSNCYILFWHYLHMRTANLTPTFFRHAKVVFWKIEKEGMLITILERDNLFTIIKVAPGANKLKNMFFQELFAWSWQFLSKSFYRWYFQLVKDDFQKKDESQKADLKSLMQVKPVTPIEEYIHVEPSNKPVPKTTAQAIGWRSAEKTHQLEKYGKYAKPKGGLVKQLNWPMEGII